MAGAAEEEGVWERHVVSGLQPTGALHVGNLFGALRRCIRAQESGDRLTLFVADLHALTTHTVCAPTHYQLLPSSLDFFQLIQL